MTHRPPKLLALALLTTLATATFADPPPANQVVPWARKSTKDMKETRTGGQRSDKEATTVKSDAALFFVAPKTTGFTTKDLPEIYWYISEPSKEVTFALISDKTKKTEVRLSLKNVQPGFHKIDLAREAKAQKFTGLQPNDFNPAAANAANAPAITAAYRMALQSKEPKLLATAYIARVKGEATDDYTVQIQNELWFDAVDSLAAQLSSAPAAKKPGPRGTFTEMLEAEEVLRSTVAPTANEDEKKKARAVEDQVLQKLSVPDPIDLQSDKWEPKGVPDPIDLNSVPDPIDLQSTKEKDK